MRVRIRMCESIIGGQFYLLEKEKTCFSVYNRIEDLTNLWSMLRSAFFDHRGVDAQATPHSDMSSSKRLGLHQEVTIHSNNNFYLPK